MTAFDRQSVSAYLAECAISVWIFQARASASHSVRADGFIKLQIVPNVFSRVFYLFAFVLKKQSKHLWKYNLLWICLPAAPPPCPRFAAILPPRTTQQTSYTCTTAKFSKFKRCVCMSSKSIIIHNSDMCFYGEQVMGCFYYPLLFTLAVQNDKVCLCVAAEGLPGSRNTPAINLHRTARTKTQNPISLTFALAELQEWIWSFPTQLCEGIARQVTGKSNIWLLMWVLLKNTRKKNLNWSSKAWHFGEWGWSFKPIDIHLKYPQIITHIKRIRFVWRV